jgi:glycine/D-amino acid oxidase-like deaminating enzyme
MQNVWIVGAGNAEGFKFGPVVGEYAANRIAGRDNEPELAAHYVFPKATYDDPPPPPPTATPAVASPPVIKRPP